jgi:hypothetical protein
MVREIKLGGPNRCTTQYLKSLELHESVYWIQPNVLKQPIQTPSQWRMIYISFALASCSRLCAIVFALYVRPDGMKIPE